MGYASGAWRPAAGTKTGRVWDIAEELASRLNREPRVSEVVKAYVSEGGHPGTGQVQYYAWKNSRDKGAADPDPSMEQGPTGRSGPGGLGSAGSPWLTISSDGVLVIPPPMREAMRLDPSGKVKAELVNGELRLASVPLVIERIQNLASQFKREGESVVDELIAERRAEAERE